MNTTFKVKTVSVKGVPKITIITPCKSKLLIVVENTPVSG